MLDFVVIVMAVVHVYIFSLESIMWGQPSTNRIFRTTDKDAQTLRQVMFNQGFYNLFLAIALLVGFMGSARAGFEAQAQAIKDYAALSILGAGLILWLSEPKLKRAALIQAGPAVVYWVVRLAT